MSLGARFQVSDYAKKFSEVVLREARTEHDSLVKEGKKRDAPSSWEKGDAKRISLLFSLRIVDATRFFCMLECCINGD